MMSAFIQKWGCIALLFITALFFQGCLSTFQSDTQAVHISAGDDSTEILVNGESQGYGTVQTEFDKSEGLSQFVELRKKGYKSDHYALYPEHKKIGSALGLNIGISVLLPFGALSVAEVETYTYPIVLGIGGLAAFFGLTRDLSDQVNAYDERYQLEAPDEHIPPYGELKKEVFVGSGEISIPEEEETLYWYSERKDHERDNDPKKTLTAEDMDLKGQLSPGLPDSLNRILDDRPYLNFSDPEELTLNYYNILKLSPTVKEIGFFYFKEENQLFVDLSVNWEVVNNREDTLFSHTITSRSGEFKGIDDSEYSSSAQESTGKALLDGFYQSLIKLLRKDEVRSLLKENEFEAAQKRLAEWDPIPLNNGGLPEDAEDQVGKGVKSVVTVQRRDEKGHGSGCVVSSDGYIVTNAHVVKKADTVTVTFNDQQTGKARVVRKNPVADLALLKLDTNGLRPLPMRHTEEIDVGNKAFAIGTPENIQLGQTLSKGIISGKREIDRFSYLQTDVSINPGNSGGALLDENGRLVGITNAKLKGADVEGVGFAIPVRSVKENLKLEVR